MVFLVSVASLSMAGTATTTTTKIKHIGTWRGKLVPVSYLFQSCKGIKIAAAAAIATPWIL